MEEKNVVQVPLLANCVSFNGILLGDPINVGGGYFAINIVGKENEEFPIILLKISEDDLKEAFIKKDDWIAGLGILKKVQNEWTITAIQINRIPTEEEFKKMN